MPWQKQWVKHKEIERGGQGIITELRDKQAPETRAILKQIVPQWENDRQAIERLRKETEILIKLHGIGARVPAVYDSFINHSNTKPFLLMEFIKGVRFDKWLKKSAPVSPLKAVEVTLAIADTIRLCQEHKIGHRDLKPTNIILKNGLTDQPYVLDFGISFDSCQTYVLTREGEMFWNEFLVLPECQDLQGGHRDLRSDITALVGIFYSCITGKTPGVLRDALERSPHRREPEEVIFSIADNLEQGENMMWFFDKGFAFRIDDRFQVLEEFINEIQRFRAPDTQPPINLLEQFRLFDETLKSQDRGIQLVQLRKNYSQITRTIDIEMNKLSKELKGLNGQLRIADIRLQDSACHLLPQTGDHLQEKIARQYCLARENFKPAAHVYLVAFGVGMQIYLYKASITAPISGRGPNLELAWSKIAVIDEGVVSLSKSKLEMIVKSLQTSLAQEIRNLAQKPRNQT